MNNEFIAGFFCGEGWINKHFVKGGFYAFTIGINMHARDLGILEAIAEYLKMGYIKEKKDKSVVYRIHRTADIIKFADQIGVLLIGYKKLQFDKWYSEFKEYKELKHSLKYSYDSSHKW